MPRRTCANCHAADWFDYRWCRDCWRAMGKGAAAALGSALALALARWLTS